MSPIPEERLARVEELYLQGMPARRIEKVISRQYGITPRQANNYLFLVRQRLGQAHVDEGKDADAIRARSEELLLEAYAVAKEQRRPADMALCAQRLLEARGLWIQKSEVAMTGLGDMLASVFNLPTEPQLEPRNASESLGELEDESSAVLHAGIGVRTVE